MILWFQKVRWKNFLSTGNTWVEIELDKCQTSLVVGENGAGKSTLLDAICFALYGCPFRKVVKGQLLNTINNKDCVVELWFRIGDRQYFVRRGIKPSIFEVYQDDNLLNQDADNREYQEHFEKLIFRLDFASFRQVVVLGSAMFVPFMQLEKKDRSKMIEGLLGTQIFSTMALLHKEKVKKNKDELVQVDAYIAATERTIENEKRLNVERKQNAEEMVNEKRAKIIELSRQILEADLQKCAAGSEADNLRDQLKGEAAALKKYKEYASLITSLQTKRAALNNHIQFFEKNDSCPTCKQSITPETKEQVKHKGDELVEFDGAIYELTNKQIKIELELDQHKRTREWMQKFESSEREYSGKITLWESFKRDIEADIQKIQQSSERINSSSTALADAERQLAGYQKDRENLILERHVNDMAVLLLKETGIKTKIVKQYIPIINRFVNKYLASMDFFVNFELDENFQEKVKSRFRDEFTYESFSEGEKARLDLALLFTWRAIAKMRNSASTNLLILDEVFDGSLDAQGNEELLKILHSLTAGNNVFVITHKTDAFVDKFERVIKFEKHKNFSRLVEAV